MSFIEIVGGKRLHGEITIQGSKNAVLPILAATVLVKGISKINNCPQISDVYYMLKILEQIGCKTWWEDHTVYVDSTYMKSISVPDEFVSGMRSSVILLGSLIGRMHHVVIAYPGGCSIGARPIDYHLSSFEKMNVQVDEKDNHIYCSTDHLTGTDIHLKFPSVGATENIILAAVLAKGTTRIYNAAREPEIDELCHFLNHAGAKIQGIGTGWIKIEGVEGLNSTEYTVVSDRIVAGTYVTMVASTGGEIVLNGVDPEHVLSLIEVLTEMGCDILSEDKKLTVKSAGRLKACELLITRPYPGFPTDLQSQMMSMFAIADGTSTIIEDIFEARYSNITELNRMGANIQVEGKAAIIRGVEKLIGADVRAFDLRGGAAMCLAGLVAEGTTRVHDIHFIERGYEDICKDLSCLGAKIRRIDET